MAPTPFDVTVTDAANNKFKMQLKFIHKPGEKDTVSLPQNTI